MPVDGFAEAEGDALQGSAGPGVEAGFPGGGKPQGDLSGKVAAHHAEAQFWFCGAHPTLSNRDQSHEPFLAREGRGLQSGKPACQGGAAA